jgi:hypothetical protein
MWSLAVGLGHVESVAFELKQCKAKQCSREKRNSVMWLVLHCNYDCEPYRDKMFSKLTSPLLEQTDQLNICIFVHMM